MSIISLLSIPVSIEINVLITSFGGLALIKFGGGERIFLEKK